MKNFVKTILGKNIPEKGTIPDIVDLGDGLTLTFPPDWSQQERAKHLRVIQESLKNNKKELGI